MPTAMPDEAPEAAADDSRGDGKQKQGSKRKHGSSGVVKQFTIRNPEWSYLHLALISPTSLRPYGHEAHEEEETIDHVTAYLHIQSALRSYLGLHGTAMTFDILKMAGKDIWVRVPRQDVQAMVAAVGGWAGSAGHGLRVVTWDCWGPTRCRDGMDLFGD